MAIRRVTGAVSPSELIFADANALGATYDGSGTTIERGETFTLPAGGTTAVSNGALRLEALKGDCTITNNGNSTLTNASGVDGTIIMRSGASDFPAFVRNSSMGSMSTPAREDFTGSLLGAGTFDGTLDSSVTFPAGNILQVVEAEDNTHATKSIGFHDIVTTPTITTKKANSKFIIFGHTGAGYPNSGSSNFIMFFKRTTGGSDTDIGYFTDGNRQGGVSAGQVTSNLEHPTCISGMYQDSPSLAKGSTLTYTLRMGVRDGGVVLHRVGSSTDDDWASRWHSRIFVWELAV